MNKNRSICLITYLLHKAFIPPLSNLEKILYPISDNLYSIEGNLDNLMTSNENKIHKFKISHKQESYLLLRILRLIYLQLKISLKLIMLSKNIDLCVFFAGQWEFLPILTAKLLRKKIIWLLPSFFPKMEKYDVNRTSLDKYYLYVMYCSMYLCDKIIIYSPNLVKEWNLKKYQKKISFAHEHFLDFKKFVIENEYSSRENIIGYVGRLSEEKGILNFVKSIIKIIKYKQDLKFLIIGSGELKHKIEDYLVDNNLNQYVKLIEWVPHNELKKYLNKMKLCVLPSYTEGLPNIMLESIACGTPVLAMPVGAVPDIISEGKNGFILDDNTPKCITENVLKILDLPNDEIEKIIENAHRIVTAGFTYKNTIKNWSKIINEI